jgi:hypothetical protein
LTLLAALLMPAWNTDPAIPAFIDHLMQSADNQLRYKVMLLLLRNKKPVADTMLGFFARNDDYRYQLYHDLHKAKLGARFPSGYQQVDLAKSELLQLRSYNVPDSIAYIDKLPVAVNGRKGYVLFFRYKEKKDDNGWKLATVGMVPEDAAKYRLDFPPSTEDDDSFDFTAFRNSRFRMELPAKEQLQKELKKQQYAKRRSGSRFYGSERSYFDFSRLLKE